MPIDITASELRARVGETIDRVIAGETFTIYRYGRPIAVLSPVKETRSAHPEPSGRPARARKGS